MKLSDYEYYRTDLGVLYCGDCLEILPLIDNVDLVLTDPPYNFNFDYDTIDDNLSQEDYFKFCRNIFCNVDKISNRFIVTPGTKNLWIWLQIKYTEHVACWIKKNWTTSCKIAKLQQWEPIVFYGDFKNDSRKSDLFEYNRVFQKDIGNGHPCPKQIKLWDDIVSCYSKENDLILDMFSGSGTTGVSCEKLNRRWIGIEISEKYCEIAKHRIEDEARQIKMF